jgi:uncharacterized protein with HEPN domain
MTRDQQRLADYLAHIVEAIERIDRYTGDMDELTFLNNQLVQDAVISRYWIPGGCDASNTAKPDTQKKSVPTGTP